MKIIPYIHFNFKSSIHLKDIQENAYSQILLVFYSNINNWRMSRDRRSNSDRQPLRRRITSNGSFKSSQTLIDSHNFSFYQHRNAQTKNSNCPETPTKINDSQEKIMDTLRLVKHFYQNEDMDYYTRMKKYFAGQWQGYKKIFNEHLNKLSYMENDMRKKNYNEIELEIVTEWRKNPVLYSVRAFWYQYVLGQKFASIGDFMKKYNLFKDFIGQTAYIYFQKFFNSQGNKDTQHIIDKLTERTSHMIITHTKTWQQICVKHVMPLLKSKLTNSNIADIQLSKIDLDELEIKTIAVDYRSQQQKMPKTTDKIQKFILQNKMLSKIKLLIEIRENMELQIRQRQQYLIRNGVISEIKVLDKDDFVDCLVYCVVKGDISLQNLGLSIKYFYYILGPDSSNILSKFRCDSYLADLEVTYDFLVMHLTKNSLDNISVSVNNQNNRIN